MNSRKITPLFALPGMLIIGSLPVRISSQSGAQFEITQAVVSSGGGRASGGQLSLDSSTGQSVYGGAMHGGTFAITSGLWNFTPSGPTAASVGIGGRILTADRHGIRNVSISLTHVRTGEVRAAISSSFGYYRFDDLAVGETYFMTVRAKQYRFDPDTRLITLLDEMNDQDFVALPQ